MWKKKTALDRPGRRRADSAGLAGAGAAGREHGRPAQLIIPHD